MLFPVEFTSHRLRILVNGLDVVATAYPTGGFHQQPVAGFSPFWLLGSDGLTATSEARELAVGGSDTTDDQLIVRVRQVGSHAIWDCWRLTDIGRVIKEGSETGLGTFRFDSQAYADELAQATVRAGRRWPARLVAEYLQAVLWREGHGQDCGAWVREYAAIRAPAEQPDVVEISYYARDHSRQRYALPGRYVMTFPIDDTDPVVQARFIAHRVAVAAGQRRAVQKCPVDRVGVRVYLWLDVAVAGVCPVPVWPRQPVLLTAVGVDEVGVEQARLPAQRPFVPIGGLPGTGEPHPTDPSRTSIGIESGLELYEHHALRHGGSVADTARGHQPVSSGPLGRGRLAGYTTCAGRAPRTPSQPPWKGVPAIMTGHPTNPSDGFDWTGKGRCDQIGTAASEVQAQRPVRRAA